MAEYRFGESTDHMDGFARLALAVKFAALSTPIDCGVVSAVATVLPAASKTCQLTLTLSACLPWFSTTVPRNNIADLAFTAVRTVVSHLPRCSASVLYNHTCR